MLRSLYIATATVLVANLMVPPAGAAKTATAERRGASTESGVAVTSTEAATGHILGVVTDGAGAALDRVLISASGPSGTTLAVCDAEGRFEFRSLQAGQYLLRTHLSGFTTSRRLVVDVRPDSPTVQSLTLRPEHDTMSAAPVPHIVVAGFGTSPALMADVTDSHRLQAVFAPGGGTGAGQNTDGIEPVRDESDAPPTSLAPHDHGTKAWRLRRARRSVLKNVRGLMVDGEVELPEQWAMELDSPLGGSPLANLVGSPIAGELQLLTRTTLNSSGQLWSVDSVPGQIAHVSLAPTREGAWAVRGAVDMTTADTLSWAVAGWYEVDPRDDHAVEVGASYSKHQFARDERTTLLARSGERISPYSRDVGRIEAFDTWTVSPRFTVGYGASFARYGYLDDGNLFSPRAQATITPLPRTRARVAISQHMLAPGAQEFVPPVSGVWLPPERTFTSLSRLDPLQSERARHVEVAVERDVGSGSVVGLRRFYQDVNDQLITMFNLAGQSPTDGFNALGGHYYLATAGGVNTDGWGVAFRHDVAGRLLGTVDYSVVRAQWLPSIASGLFSQTIGALRTGFEQFHDVTTSVETTIPETSTRVFALCRVNTAFTRVDSHGATSSGVDARFDVRVTQTLPFSPFDGSSWEVLITVRSLFHDQTRGASAYDELLVVSPPRQFVGGLVVHF